MNNGEEQQIIDIWDLDTSKYREETASDEEHVEEVVVEVEADGADKVDQTPEEPKQGEEPEQKVDEKQDEEEEIVEEDASSVQELEPSEELYQDLMQGFVDDGVLDFGEDEEKEVDFNKNGLKGMLEETIQKRSSEAVASFKEELGDKGKQLLSVLEKGGSVDDFVKMEQQVDFKEIPLVGENGKEFVQNQRYLVEDWMEIQGYEKEEIQELIGEYQNNNMLKKQAELAQKKLAKWQSDKNQALMEQKESEKAEQAKAEAEQAEAFRDQVINTREIAGFNIPEKKAKKLYDFITKTDKEGKSEFAKADTAENRLLYAYFAMEGFNKDALSKEIASKQARKLKRTLSRQKDSKVEQKGKQIRNTGGSPKIHWEI